MPGLWEWIAGVAVVLTSLSLTPQLWKSLNTRRTDDLSYVMLAVIATGNLLWIAHGLHRRDYALVVANIVLCSTTVTLLILKRLYDRQ